MTLSTSYVCDELLLEGAYKVDRILVHDAAMAKLTIDTSAPSENLTFVGYGSGMIVTKGKLEDAYSSQLFQDSRLRLLFGVYLA